MTDYTTLEINKILKGTITGNNNFVEYLLTDSRQLNSPENSLFFALVGNNHDGHNFINSLYKKGVVSFIVSKLPEDISKYQKACFILVKNTLAALQELAAYHRKQFNIPVIGITGSNGKTIVKEWLSHSLQKELNVIRSPKSYNSQIGVPLSTWLINKDHDLAILEAGISIPNEMENLQKIINPTIGIITNIGEAHQKNFNSITQKINEKLKLFAYADTIIYCRDHKQIHEQIINNNNLKNKNLFTWSQKSEADLTINNINTTNNNTEIEGIYKKQNAKITIPYTDRASIEDALHTWAFLLYLDNKQINISESLKTLPKIAMRLEQKKGINNCTIINDSYNSDINSLQIALNYLQHQNQNTKRTLILSDIFQSGKSETELYTEVSELLKINKIDKLIGIGKSLNEQQKIFDVTESCFYNTTSEFISNISKTKFNKEAILLKGSRDFFFEKISNILEEKVHRTILE
nr:UDP-N-acetylmuramoyl-tripeptide--D-alanyl-D-alanine ligase [Bacteroidales bacterium]